MERTSIDLSSPEFLANPYPLYSQMRHADGPVWFSHMGRTGGMWMFTRYDDVTTILKEQHTSKDESRLVPLEELTPLSHTMLVKDPPDHTRLRNLATQAFTPGRIRDLEPRIEQIVDNLLAQVHTRGEMDFMSAFALPLPVMLIAELLGVPYEDRDAFRALTTMVVTGVDAVNANKVGPEKQMEAMQSLAGYFTSLIAKRRQVPQNDLISALITARDQQDRLSEQELLGMCILLLIAGHETTVNLLGNGLLTLLRHPDQSALLKSHPEYIPGAVEEMLRFESPVQRATFRVATDSLRIGGTFINPGQQLSAVIGAANRDPEQFPNPDVFDVTRQPNRHVAFGLGLHFCLGAPLARAEGRIGFTRLLERLPSMRLVTQFPDWNSNTFFRGLKTLPVTF